MLLRAHVEGDPESSANRLCVRWSDDHRWSRPERHREFGRGQTSIIIGVRPAVKPTYKMHVGSDRCPPALELALETESR